MTRCFPLAMALCFYCRILPSVLSVAVIILGGIAFLLRGDVHFLAWCLTFGRHGASIGFADGFAVWMTVVLVWYIRKVRQLWCPNVSRDEFVEALLDCRFL